MTDWNFDRSSDFGGFIDKWLTENKKQEGYQGISKNHWKPNNARSCCANSKCAKIFTITERHHHCRRCGDVFCNKCTQYQRRLNNLAHLDPAGILYKVCKACFDDVPQESGQTHSHTDSFIHSRKHRSGSNGIAPSSRFDIKAEIERLKDGFKDSVSKSPIRKSISQVKSLMSSPEWQKSIRYIFYKLSPRCYGCRVDFNSLTKKQHFCTVCGMVFCSKCSNKDLIVYIPNEHKKDKEMAEPLLGIIRIVGCPEKEPDMCSYLRVCESCHQLLEQIQVLEYQQTQVYDEVGGTWSAIENVNRDLRAAQQKIDDQLPKFQEIILSLDIVNGAPMKAGSNRSNVQTLAKAQENLLDYFSNFMFIVQRLKKVKPTTKGQIVVLNNLLKCKHSIYQESLYLFGQSKKKCEETMPQELLLKIQHIVETNAIRGAYITCKQLVFESIHLCDKYKLKSPIPKTISDCTQVLEPELQNVVETNKENWEEYQQNINDLLRFQLKEHRMIRPSDRRIKLEGCLHVETVMLWRTDSLLTQIRLELEAKCRDKTYKNSKNALEELQTQIKQLAT